MTGQQHGEEREGGKSKELLRRAGRERRVTFSLKNTATLLRSSLTCHHAFTSRTFHAPSLLFPPSLPSLGSLLPSIALVSSLQLIQKSGGVCALLKQHLPGWLCLLAVHYAPFLSHFPSPDFFLSFFFKKKKAARLVRHQGVDNNCGCEREREGN